MNGISPLMKQAQGLLCPFGRVKTQQDICDPEEGLHLTAASLSQASSLQTESKGLSFTSHQSVVLCPSGPGGLTSPCIRGTPSSLPRCRTRGVVDFTCEVRQARLRGAQCLSSGTCQEVSERDSNPGLTHAFVPRKGEAVNTVSSSPSLHPNDAHGSAGTRPTAPATAANSRVGGLDPRQTCPLVS